MKKVFILSFMLCFTASFCVNTFGEGGGVGNEPGLNKIGGILGFPTGLSFSHMFTDKDQIDLTVGLFPGLFLIGHGYGYYGYFTGDIALGYLRSVWEPTIEGAKCPLEIGGGISFTMGNLLGYSAWMTAYFDLRWEIFFTSVPKFNMFLDFSPGIGFWLHEDTYVYYAPRGGIGFRAVL